MKPCLVATMLTAGLCLGPSAAPAQDDAAPLDFIEGNVLGMFYHEVGHALIDLLDLPVLGQEEDAADVLAVVMTNRLWLEDHARAVANATALSYRFSTQEEGSEPEYWDVHGPDEQRFYNTVCLFYGADVETRDDFAAAHDLPEDRAETCAEEFALAEASWNSFLDDIAIDDDAPPAASFAFEDLSEGEDDIAALLANEVDDLNARFRLPVTVPVRLEPCGEANAFFWPEDRSITVCTELAGFLRGQAERGGL